MTAKCPKTGIRLGEWLLHCHINHYTTNDNVDEQGGDRCYPGQRGASGSGTLGSEK